MIQPTSSLPNIIFILADDLGYADLSIYGQTEFETPHLDMLATQGVRFTQAYANSAVCSATRFALITGRYQYRLRGGLEEPLVSAADLHGLPPEHPTLPSLLKQKGYKTALIGKWHLGNLPKFGPLKSGYDKFFGNYGGAIDYFTHKPGVGDDVAKDLYEDEVPIDKVGYYTEILADKASEWLSQQTKQQPFFLSLHFTAPHWPWVGPEDEAVSQNLKDIFHHDGGNLKIYAKMVQSLDKAVGTVLLQLESQGLSDNTIVVFSSDNGGERFAKTWPFTGQKSELLEGGIRVPTLLRWPAKVKPQICDQVTVSMDWLPTLLAAAQTPLNENYLPDGDNILPVILNQKNNYERNIYWRYKAQGQRAFRSGPYKYLKINDNEFLFNVELDTLERANLKNKEPHIFEKLKQEWLAWDKKFLPISPEVFTHGLSPDIQADRYRTDAEKRLF